MPDTIDDDRLADLFAQFRAGARTEIVQPGALQAHRTVRRRRHTARLASAAAALVVVGAAGAVATTTSHGGSTTADTQRWLSPDERAAIGTEALAKLGFSPETERTTTGGPLPLRPGIAYGVLDADATAKVYRFGDAADPLPAGDYTVVAYCAGKGGITIGWRSGGDRGSDGVPCGAAVPTGAAIHTTGTIDITITPYGEAATDRPGFAFAITDPREILARRLANLDLPRSLSNSAGVININMRNQDDRTYEPGTYRLTFACLGYDVPVRVALTIGKASSGSEMTCIEVGQLRTFTVDVAKDSGPLVVTAETGDREVAFAYRIDRV